MVVWPKALFLSGLRDQLQMYTFSILLSEPVHRVIAS